MRVSKGRVEMSVPNSIFISSTELIGTPAMPTSPRTRSWSLSYPVSKNRRDTEEMDEYGSGGTGMEVLKDSKESSKRNGKRHWEKN